MGYSEYVHLHETVRCGEECLRTAAKVCVDDRKGLKSLSNLLEKCRVSLQNIGQSSSLDSMHVMMGSVNKLRIDLKGAWVEYSVKIERNTKQRAKFVDLSDFLTKRSRLANSIFGRETFPVRTKIRKESSFASSSVIVSSAKAETAKIIKCFFFVAFVIN